MRGTLARDLLPVTGFIQTRWKFEVGRKLAETCVDGEREPALPSSRKSMYGSQISSWYNMKTKFWRSWVMTLRCLVYGNAVY